MEYTITANTVASIIEIPKGYGTSLCFAGYYNKKCNTYMRNMIRVSVTQFTFSDAYVSYADSSSLHNHTLVPIRIYGMKYVK